MTTRRWIILGVALVVLIGAGAGLWWWRVRSTPQQTEPAPAQPVAIAIPGAPAEIRIGMVVSLTSRPGEGSEWKYAAEGAQVAVRRLSMGGVVVQLQTADDKGSKTGARRAVEQLVDQGVSGIVLASDGPHLSGAIEAARTAGVPTALPYASDPKLTGDLVWATGPLDPEVGETLRGSLNDEKRKRPLLIDVGGGTPDGMKPAAKLSFAADGDPAKLIKDVAARGKGKDKIDSVVVSGPAATQAKVVHAMQGADQTMPVFLTPEATSPAFTSTLVDAGGSLSTSLTSVGTDTGDAAALSSDDAGRAVSAFLAANRMLAGDPDRTTLLGDQPFATVAAAADVRSHDAVIALAHAATAMAASEGGDPVAVIGALRLDHTTGLAGPALDFSSYQALTPDTVVELRSSDTDLGLRPGTDEPAPRLIWFAAP